MICNKNRKHEDLYPWHWTPESQNLHNTLMVDAFENGTLDNFKSNEDLWYDKIEEVKLFLENNNRRPLITSKDEIEQNLSHWISCQLSYRVQYTPTKEMEETWNTFTNKYIRYFQTNEDLWFMNLKNLKIFLHENKRRPYQTSTNTHEKTTSRWLYQQLKIRSQCIHIMSKKEIQVVWDEFKEEYSEYFRSNEDSWKDNLKELQLFLDENKRRPCNNSSDEKEKRINRWVLVQIKNRSDCVEIMSRKHIQDIWDIFHEKFIHYFQSCQEIWEKKLMEAKCFFEIHKTRPRLCSKDKTEKKIGNWISSQIYNRKKYIDIMSHSIFRDKWDIFINNHEEYFKSNEEVWYENLDGVEEFIHVHKKRPIVSSNDANERKLGQWIGYQVQKMTKRSGIMANEEIRDVWDNFTSSHLKHFKSTRDVWYDNVNKVSEFIELYKKLPSAITDNEEEKYLDHWLKNQIQNREIQQHCMTCNEIREIWDRFKGDYAKYFT